MPGVSVIVPNYNHAPYLPERLASVLDQTYRDFEVILLDDASTDDSRTVIESYRREPRVTIHLNEQNSGSTYRQWNRGLGLATGRYVWIAESDDACAPELLATLVAELERHPRAAIAACQSYTLSADGDRVLFPGHRPDPGNLWGASFVMDGPTLARREFLFANGIPNASCAVFRRDLAQEIGGADESYRLRGDRKFWIELLLRGDFVWVGQPLNYFRTHATTVRARSRRSGVEALEHYRLAAYLRSRLSPDSRSVRSLRYLAALKWLDFLQSRDEPVPWSMHARILRAALAIDPVAPARWIRVWFESQRRPTDATGGH